MLSEDLLLHSTSTFDALRAGAHGHAQETHPTAIAKLQVYAKRLLTATPPHTAHQLWCLARTYTPTIVCSVTRLQSREHEDPQYKTAAAVARRDAAAQLDLSECTHELSLKRRIQMASGHTNAAMSSQAHKRRAHALRRGGGGRSSIPKNGRSPATWLACPVYSKAIHGHHFPPEGHHSAPPCSHRTNVTAA